MAIQEGRWDCQSCGTKGILGRHKACPHCGMPRPDDVKFYLPEDAPEVTDRELLKQAEAGADWYCEYCGSGNGADRDTCKQCGAERGASKTHEVKEYSLDEVPRDGRKIRPKEHVQPPKPKRGISKGKIIGIGFLIVLIALAGYFFIPKKEAAKVSAFSWAREILIEKYKTVREEDWSVPNGGRIVKQRQEVHHHEKVLDHYEIKERRIEEKVQTGTREYVCGKIDMGSGYFKDKMCTEPVYEIRYRTETYKEPVYRDEPVYQTKYTYDIDKWVVERSAKAAGNDQQPQWPEVKLGEHERAGTRGEMYKVHFIDEKGEPYEVEMKQDEWKTFKQGEKCTLKINKASGEIEVIRGS